MTQKGLRILVADDDPQMQLAISATLGRGGHDVVTVGDGQRALETLEAELFDLVISDQRMPEMTGQELLAQIQKREMPVPFIMITAHGTINQAVEAMQLGAADFISKPFSAEELERIVDRVMSPENRAFRSKSKRARRGKPIISSDPVMIRVLSVAEAVARSDATVLVQGESGTGKELIARLIHTSSPRAEQPFVAVNCAALPATLLESELFGHEKGAFTGAQQRKIGKFEMAQGGTILLDEISEMDLALQAKLLRVLQEREVDRVGGRDPITIDVRVIATTNRNLEDAVRNGLFRADLFYRLNVIPITLPPLRERRGDIKLLIDHFMKQYLADSAPELSPEILRALLNYRWPGNVRELQNAVERAAILSQGAAPKESDFLLHNSFTDNSALKVEVEHVASVPSEQAAPNVSALSDSLQISAGVTVQEMERRLILETLKATNDNRTQAAKLLGISIRTLRNKLHEYGHSGADQSE
ncbi:MAG: sigma-54 dependent transcriptional regulator [Oligoflexia bacterium]|nr:sigma-54 dependent transcriptional regulator [Oligoflexia bacterium]